jgi:hypothetical protein
MGCSAIEGEEDRTWNLHFNSILVLYQVVKFF